MGWGAEVDAIIFGIDIGWFTTGKSGAIVLTFNSGPSNNLSFNVYGATVTTNRNDFNLKLLNGKGVEYSLGWFANYTRASNNLDKPDYLIHQVSYGLGYYKVKVSGGVSQTGTLVIPTLPVLIVEPIY